MGASGLTKHHAGMTIDSSTTTWKSLGHRTRWPWRRSTSCGSPSSSSPTRKTTRPPWGLRILKSPSRGDFKSNIAIIQWYSLGKHLLACWWEQYLSSNINLQSTATRKVTKSIYIFHLLYRTYEYWIPCWQRKLKKKILKELIMYSICYLAVIESFTYLYTLL